MCIFIYLFIFLVVFPPFFQGDDNGWGLPIFQDNDGGWGDDDKELEIKRYFRAEYFTEEETNQKS